MRWITRILVLYVAFVAVYSLATYVFSRTPVQAYRVGSMTKPAVLFSLPGRGAVFAQDLVSGGDPAPRDPRYAPGGISRADANHFVFLLSSEPEPDQDALLKQFGFDQVDIDKVRNDKVSISTSGTNSAIELKPLPFRKRSYVYVVYNSDWLADTYQTECHLGIVQDMGAGAFERSAWSHCTR